MTPPISLLWLAYAATTMTIQGAAATDRPHSPAPTIETAQRETPAGGRASNVLLLILDDVGKESIGCYPGAASDVRTPVIDGLAGRGVRFDRAWSNPACSPTRATVLTGRFGFRTGVGSVKALAARGLRPEEVTLAESLHERHPELRTAFLGKWHLGPTEPQGPVAQGFERFRGTSGNLREKSGANAYFEFKERTGRSVATTPRRRYATSAVVDDALEVIAEFEDDPWLVIASFHAAHTPFHAPPPDLHTRTLKGPPEAHARAHFMATVDALDAEIGRLLAGIPAATLARTHIIVLSDNGTASKAQPEERALRVGKGSLFEDGICVPLIVAGPAVTRPGRGSSALVNTTDLHSTVHVLLGADPAPEAVDSVSFAGALSEDAEGARTWSFAERFQLNPPPGRWSEVDRYSITDGRFKLTVDVLGGSTRLHDLDEDPEERLNLLHAPELTEDAVAAKAALERTVRETLQRGPAMAARRAGRPGDPDGSAPEGDPEGDPEIDPEIDSEANSGTDPKPGASAGRDQGRKRGGSPPADAGLTDSGSTGSDSTGPDSTGSDSTGSDSTGSGPKAPRPNEERGR